MKQSLCPYTLKPLAEISNTNGEHILPRAFGAPESFTVPADEAENTRMNDQIDSPAINDPLMRLLAVTQGVKSRSGSVRAKLKGVVTESGEEVIAILGQEGIDFRFVAPVDVDENGSVKGVRGFGDAAQKLVNQFLRDSARKGRKMEVDETVSQPNPHLSLGLEGDLKVIHKEVRKIAYLMTVRIFGDEAIKSRSGEIYRAAIHAETEEEVQATGLRGGTNIDSIATLARAKHNEHALTCFRIGSAIVSAVILFGSITGICITPAEGFSAPELAGEVIIINATTGTLTSAPYDQWIRDFMQTPEFGQAMVRAASLQTYKT
ncbi:hypothetical protein [Paludibacterium denitrificans]|uniref:Uncharacterized protein n=1 Tax=Paludibacterium denitrificans TaxID=2675226 RepID=A0A844GFE8_9NEIS|nr:hypothetical protein [Paludibacterium denitrificans]MTD33948.1 hypothetical protein [Paludibacterium denitrificans]